MAALDPITAALNIGTSIIERIFPDKSEQEKAKLALLQLQQQGEMAKITAAAGVVQAEAVSDSFLANSWRPIVMLTFTVLIVARWFGYAAPGISESEAKQLWDIVEFGLGGYVVGRSVEKVVPQIASAVVAARTNNG